MKNKFLCTEYGIYFLIFLAVIPAIELICVSIWSKSLDIIIFTIVIVLIPCIILLAARKVLFSKIKLSDEGISKIYGKKILKTIKWDEIYEVKALPHYNILFSEREMTQREIFNSYTDIICFRINRRNLNIILNYKDKFKDKISDISLLGKYYEDILRN